MKIAAPRLLAVALAALGAAACARMRPVPPADGLAPVGARATVTRARFDRTRGSTIDVRWREGHTPLVRPMVNGADVGWFVLDTGASGMTITEEAARAADLTPVGTTLLQGQFLTTVYEARTFELGALSLRGVRFAGMDLPGASFTFGDRVVGFCGYEVFAHVVFELDVANGTAVMHDPASYELEEGAWEQLHIRRNLPHVRCRFEGEREGLFLVDAGFDGAVWMLEHAVRDMDLLADRSARRRTILNLDGSTEVQVGALEWFEMGGTRMNDVSCSFSMEEVSLYAGAPDVIGIVGVDLLRRFRVVFDYERGRAAFVAVEEEPTAEPTP